LSVLLADPSLVFCLEYISNLKADTVFKVLRSKRDTFEQLRCVLVGKRRAYCPPMKTDLGTSMQ
jgi:hypothetical protein